MEIDGKCYDEFPKCPTELKPMLDALFDELLARDLIQDNQDSAIEFFAMWMDEIA